MLSLLLQTIEKSFGPSLSLIADIAFWTGATMVAYLVITPLLRVALEMRAARIGLERHWVMTCPNCTRLTVVSGPVCEECGKTLGIPLAVRIRNFFSGSEERRWLRWIRWILTACGVALFALITAAVAIRSGAWNPQTTLERLFIGLSMVAWAGLGWLIARVVGIGTGGPISRLRDAVFALATVAVLTATLAVAGASRPAPETLVARINIQGQVAQLGKVATPLVGYQFGFEYLQVDHELIGFHRIVPLAVVGAQRIPLLEDGFTETLTSHLWAHAHGYTDRGLIVRKRTEQIPASEPGLYEIVVRGGEISVRRYKPPPG
ncbi:MAG: hypothetical protein WDZ63_12385 [Burkholderiales bacterium]